MKEIKLPSGAILKIQPAPFASAKALYQSMLRELKSTKMEKSTVMANVYKDIFCGVSSSPEFESHLSECLKRCLYHVNGVDLKIDDQTFEPVHARQDYTTVCMEVAKENITPFVKSLLSELLRLIAEIEGFQNSKSTKMKSTA